MSLRRLFLVSLLAAAAALTSSCLSPTLPLPPPDAPDQITESTPHQWTISGDCEPGAIVSVVNRQTGLGRIYTDEHNTGSYVVTLEGNECDPAELQEQIDTQLSPTTDFSLRHIDAEHPVDNPGCGDN